MLSGYGSLYEKGKRMNRVIDKLRHQWEIEPLKTELQVLDVNTKGQEGYEEIVKATQALRQAIEQKLRPTQS